MSEEILKGKKLILEEAGKLFMQSGYREVSMRDIAKACDMTNAAIYYHFEDKEALSPKEKIQKMLTVFLNFSFRAETSFTRMMHDLRYLMKEKHGNSGKFMHSPSGKNLLKPMDDCFEQAEKSGEIQKLSEPFLHSSLLMSLNRGVVTTLVHGPDCKLLKKQSVEELAEMVVNIYWHGIEK